MAAKTLTLDNIRRFLGRCGYRASCLPKDYVYYSCDTKHTVSLVGFANEHFNSENACIAVADFPNLPEDQIQDRVLSYRELGAPAILVNRGHEMQFWKYQQQDVQIVQCVLPQGLDTFFTEYRSQFSPEEILRAKTFGRANRTYHQLAFVDYGLMPLIEEKEGQYISTKIEQIIIYLSDYGNINQQSEAGAKWLTQAAFWLIGAKILRDKGVEGFKVLDLANVDGLVDKMKRHYNAGTPLEVAGNGKRRALERVAEEIVKPISCLAHITVNSLAYVYENTLITQATRKALGTHATPAWLVNYIVWQMADWIEEIPERDRRILEPACGHAPFLTIGAKLLSLLYDGPDEKRHEYLKNHLLGVDKDSFALEIARLSLTLTDIPNANGWHILTQDIYADDILPKAARHSTILLCNPPFENFKPADKKSYANLETVNKAAEVLARTLPYMPEGSVFGVVLPQGFLHKKNLAGLRKDILDHCEVRQICNLPDNAFEHAEHVSTVLLGRRKKGGTRALSPSSKVSYLTVSKRRLEHFKETLDTPEEKIPQAVFSEANHYNFRIPELKELWDYCRTYPVFKDVCDIGQGLVFKGRDIPKSAVTFKNQPFPGGVEGFIGYDEVILITDLPPVVYLNLSPAVIRRKHWGTDTGNPQVLLNYARVSRDPWRLKAWIDKRGHPVTSNFLVVRPKDIAEWPLECVWALLNSPYANAFVYSHSMERANTAGLMRTMPVPSINPLARSIINELVLKYFSISANMRNDLINPEALTEAKEILLSIDAEVLRLYDLPPRLEKRLLDYFAGVHRKGVSFTFDRYYEEGFDSYIPLHMYISSEFQNSSVENVRTWVGNNRTPEVIEAFKTAVNGKK